MRDFDYKKSLGQNFLKDNNIINKIVGSINPNKNDLIVEIGPGSGALTRHLIKKGCDVICFEIDERLKDILCNIDSNNLKIIFGDFLKMNLKEHIDTNKYEHIYFIGNLPYYITTAIINKIIDESNPYEIVIMIQKEVGDRFISKPRLKSYNSLSVFLQYNFDIIKVTDVSRHCFNPVPNVESVVLKLVANKKYNVSNEKFFYEFVSKSFTQKRKNLRNNLKSYDLDKINNILLKMNKDLTARAEEISVKEFVDIVNEYLNNRDL